MSRNGFKFCNMQKHPRQKFAVGFLIYHRSIYYEEYIKKKKKKRIRVKNQVVALYFKSWMLAGSRFSVLSVHAVLFMSELLRYSSLPWSNKTFTNIFVLFSSRDTETTEPPQTSRASRPITFSLFFQIFLSVVTQFNYGI